MAAEFTFRQNNQYQINEVHRLCSCSNRPEHYPDADWPSKPGKLHLQCV